jgi:putative ABC transport system ATP-binding protein
MTELNRKGATIIVVTHDPGVAKYTNRTIRIVDGCIAS